MIGSYKKALAPPCGICCELHIKIFVWKFYITDSNLSVLDPPQTDVFLEIYTVRNVWKNGISCMYVEFRYKLYIFALSSPKDNYLGDRDMFYVNVP